MKNFKNISVIAIVAALCASQQARAEFVIANQTQMPIYVSLTLRLSPNLVEQELDPDERWVIDTDTYNKIERVQFFKQPQNVNLFPIELGNLPVKGLKWNSLSLVQGMPNKYRIDIR